MTERQGQLEGRSAGLEPGRWLRHGQRSRPSVDDDPQQFPVARRGARVAAAVLQWGHPRASSCGAPGCTARFNGAILVRGWKGQIVSRREWRSVGFNGAILVRGWKDSSRDRSGCGLPASMGPSSCEDGKCEFLIGGLDRDFASMGPSSCEDGKPVSSPARARARSRLQWGHPRARMERRLLAACAGPS